MNATEHGRRWSESIARKMAMSMILISTVIIVMGAVIQVYLEYRHDAEEVARTIDNAHNSMEASILESLWLANDDMVAVAMQGILSFPYIEKVVVVKEDGTHLSRGHSDAEKTAVHTHPLTRIYRGQSVPLGHITLTANLDWIFNQLLEHTLVGILAQASLAILLSLSSMWLFHRLVGRHLYSLSTYSQALSINSLDLPLRLDRKMSKPHGT